MQGVQEYVMFPPDDVRRCERSIAGRGKCKPWRTSRVAPSSLPSPRPPGPAVSHEFLRSRTPASVFRARSTFAF